MTDATNTDETEMTTDDELGRIEDVLAALPPEGERILAGIGAGDYDLQATMLRTMPTGTAALLAKYGAMTADRQLTDFGVQLAEDAAFRHGLAPEPAVRAVVAAEVSRRWAAGEKMRSTRRPLRRRAASGA